MAKAYPDMDESVGDVSHDVQETSDQGDTTLDPMDETTDKDQGEENQDKDSDEDDESFEDDDDVDDDELSQWPDDLTVRIIELFRNSPILYDINNKNFRNKTRKAKAFQKIAKKTNCCGMYGMRY